MAYLNSMCRACLTTKASFTYFIFENVSPDTYYFCTSIEVSKDEQLPRGLCDSCYELLKKYETFKRTCLQSQTTLLDLKNDLKYEIELPTMRCDENIKQNDSQEVEIKAEILDNVVKIKDEEIEYDGDENELHHNDRELGREKHLKKKVKKLKSKQDKGIKQKVKTKFSYTCDVCRKKFIYKERFEAHKLEHEGKTVSIRCSPCNKTFLTWAGLKKHRESEHTQVNMEELTCTTCGKILKSKHTLKIHGKIHEKRRLIMCNVCGKGFSNAVVLKAHLETHKENRERLFTCEHCDKKFFTHTILLAHVSRRHSGRMFICHICSYPFTDKYILSKHILTHDRKKLFKCEICNNYYTTQSTLTEHKRIHSGERPFVCTYCNKTFISKKRLCKHIKIHAGGKPHKCTLCDQSFTQRTSLTRHMNIVHNRTDPTLTNSFIVKNLGP